MGVCVCAFATAPCNPPPPAQTPQDKDGVSAAAAFAEMAAAHARRGVGVRQHLAALSARYGARAYRSGYFIADPPSKAAGLFEDLRAGGKYPEVRRGAGVGVGVAWGRVRALSSAATPHTRAAAAPYPTPQSVGGVRVTGARAAAPRACGPLFVMFPPCAAPAWTYSSSTDPAFTPPRLLSPPQACAAWGLASTRPCPTASPHPPPHTHTNTRTHIRPWPGVRDMGIGLDTTTPDRKPGLPWAPGDLMLTLYLENGGFLVLRGSGTEPKLKYYLEVGAAEGEGAGAVAARADKAEAAVAADLVRPEARGFGVRKE